MQGAYEPFVFMKKICSSVICSNMTYCIYISYANDKFMVCFIYNNCLLLTKNSITRYDTPKIKRKCYEVLPERENHRHGGRLPFTFNTQDFVI